MSKPELEIHSQRSAWSNPQEIHFRVSSITRQWTTQPHLWTPPTDLSENDREYVVRVEIAGMQDAELNIAVENRQLAIYGLRHPPSEQGAYHRLEVRFGEFMSVVELPGEFDTDRIRAEYRDGFLLVTAPKKAGR
jgi:HSP20 family protein